MELQDKSRALQPAKDQFAASVDDLAASLKQHARDAVITITDQIKVSARDASHSLSHDVTEMAESLAEGIRTVKSEFGVPRIVRENPWPVAVGSLGLGLGLLALRSRRPRGRAGGRSITGRLAMLAIEVGLAYWLAQKRNREVPATIETYPVTPPALH
jgi:hypothetical protein